MKNWICRSGQFTRKWKGCCMPRLFRGLQETEVTAENTVRMGYWDVFEKILLYSLLSRYVSCCYTKLVPTSGCLRECETHFRQSANHQMVPKIQKSVKELPKDEIDTKFEIRQSIVRMRQRGKECWTLVESMSVAWRHLQAARDKLWTGYMYKQRDNFEVNFAWVGFLNSPNLCKPVVRTLFGPSKNICYLELQCYQPTTIKKYFHVYCYMSTNKLVETMWISARGWLRPIPLQSIRKKLPSWKT